MTVVDKSVAIPGDLLSDDASRAGEGTYVEDGKVYAHYYGIINDREKIKIIPITSKYIPKRNDVIIGIVTDIGFSNWIIDINSPYDALLHISEYPERLEMYNMSKHLRIGEMIMAHISDVDYKMKTELTMQDEHAGILRNGRLIEISHNRIPRLIGRNGSMINMLHKECKCKIFVAQNGRVWLSGREENVDLACEAILKIDNEAHTSGLTDRISEFLMVNKGRIS